MAGTAPAAPLYGDYELNQNASERDKKDYMF
jgi:hypothetical protein